MTRIKPSASAAHVVAFYADQLPCDIWPGLNPLTAWDGSALVVTAQNKEGIADALLQLANHYDNMAEGITPADYDSPRFCRDASRGLSTAWRKALSLTVEAP